MTMYPKMNERDKIDILKDILFEDDHEFEKKISQRVQLLEQTIQEKEKLSEKVDPIIAYQINEFKNSIPETLGPTITETLRKEIRINKDAVVDAIYPVLGKMIKKYVAQEMKMLSEKMNSQLSFFSVGKRKFKSIFTGKKERDLMFDDLATAKIEQVLLIEKNSGILKASFTKSKTIDEEMVSGMLTAIKSFVEDAFGQKNQSLELIDYELYQIHLQSFQKYFVAVIISGSYTIQTKDKVQDLIFDFYEDFTKKDEYKLSPDRINQELAQNFSNASL